MVSSDSELDYPPLWYPPSVRSWKPVRWDLINRHFQHWNVFIVTVWVIIHTININVQTQIMEQSNHVEYRDSFVLPVSRTGTAMEEWFNFLRLRNIRPEISSGISYKISFRISYKISFGISSRISSRISCKISFKISFRILYKIPPIISYKISSKIQFFPEI